MQKTPHNDATGNAIIMPDKDVEKAPAPLLSEVPSASGAGNSASIGEKRRRIFRLVGTLASAVLFCLSLLVLYFVIRELDAAEIKAAFSRASATQIGLALLFTFLSYLTLTGYDWVSLPEVTSQKISYGVTALASFTSYAVSFTLGFPLITAATVRYWVYSSVGLGARAIASLTLIAGITFWLGMALVLSFVMVLLPQAAATFSRLPIVMNILVGLGIFGGIAAYLILVSRKRREWVVQGWSLHIPGINVTLKQMVLGAADVCFGAAVLYVLLPEDAQTPFATMVAAYVFACFLGIASHAPGGIGVFEAVILLALPGVPREALLGALLVYRLCYYILPFMLALLLLGTREMMIRFGVLQRQLAASSGDNPYER